MVDLHRSRLLLIGAVVLLAACTSSNQAASFTPEASASPTASPSSLPSPTPSPTASGPLGITAVPVHNGEIGLAYGPVTLTATGGLPPYSWAVGTGALPAGLSLSAQGVISGAVTAAGTFKFNVAVADSGGHQATQAAAITVYKALAVKGTCAQLCAIGQGCAKCGAFGSVAGGQAPYGYKVTAGAVPKGMTLSGLALKGGFPAGVYSLSVQVTDKLGVKATVNAKWSIYSPATLSSGGDCMRFSPPVSCSVRWTYSGGSPTAAPKLVIVGYGQYCDTQRNVCGTPTAPPPGWTVSVKTGVITLSASSTACVTSYLGVLKLALVDTAACATTSQSNIVDLIVEMEFSC
jgi:hypothetical protein